MKKTLLSLLFLSVAITSSAQASFNVGDVSYTPTSATTLEVSEVRDTVTSLEIPATVSHGGIDYTVTSIGEAAFEYNKIQKVVLPETIDSIKEDAFHGTKLASINLPSSLRYIGPYAFYSTSLTSIDIPGSVKELPRSSFYSNSDLTNVTLHDGLEIIGSYAFGSSNINAIDIPATVKRIEDHAFFGSYKLPVKNLTLREGLKYIGSGAFYKCGLSSVYIPASVDSIDNVFQSCSNLKTVTFGGDGITYIGNTTFYGCSSLESITLPKTVKTLGDEVFFGCKKLTTLNIPASVENIGESLTAKTSISSITVDPENIHFHLVDGILYSTDNRLLYAAPMTGITEVKLPSNTIGIMGGAFCGSSVKKAVIPDGFLAFGDYAFEESQLEEINFPSSVTFLGGEQAFAGTNLTEVDIPENVTTVYDGTFAMCKNLKKVVIPSGVKALDIHVFTNYSEDGSQIDTVICKGSVPPALPDIYDEYDAPFYGTPTSTKLIVPKGCSKAYEDAGWGDYLTITEAANGVITPTAVSPVDSTAFASYQPMSFELTFDEPITLVNATPEVFVRANSELYQNVFTPYDGWTATVSGNKLTIYADDGDGFTDGLTTSSDDTYYITIPAGVVKNANGDENEHIVLYYTGPANTDGITAPSVSTAEGKVASRYNLSGQRVSGSQKGIQIVKFADGTTRKIIVK